MKVLLLNGNTTRAVTERMVAALRHDCLPDVQIVGVTAGFGDPYVASRAAAAVATHAALEAVRTEVARVREGGEVPFDVCFYACFGEPGIDAIRAEMPFPVVGMAEGAMVTALQMGERFSILTVGDAWPGMLRDHMRRLDLLGRCAGIGVVPGAALSLAGDRAEGARAVLEAATRTMEAQAPDVLIVAGAALAGYGRELAGRLPVPMVDSLFAGFEQSLALGRLAGGMRG